MTEKFLITDSVHTHTHTHTHTQRDSIRLQATNGNAKKVFTRLTAIVLLSMLIMFFGFNKGYSQCDPYDLSLTLYENVELCYYNHFNIQFEYFDNANIKINEFEIFTEYSGNIDIAYDYSRFKLPYYIKDNYDPIDANGQYINFNGSIISVKGKLKANHQPLTIGELKILARIYFVGNAGEDVQFNIYNSQTNQNTNKIIINDSNNNLVTCYPIYDTNNPDYDLLINYSFPGVEVGGNIKTVCRDESLVDMESVPVGFYKNDFSPYCTNYTNTQGDYVCISPTFCNIDIVPNGETLTLNDWDVTKLDLTVIMKHLLGLLPFNHVYQFLSSDANSDNMISANDLLCINKVIVSSGAETCSGWSNWKIIPANFYYSLNLSSFPNGTTIPYYDQYIELSVPDNDVSDIDFITLKTGNPKMQKMDFCQHSSDDEINLGSQYISLMKYEKNDSAIVEINTNNRDSFLLFDIDLHIQNKNLLLDTILFNDALVSEESKGYFYDFEKNTIRLIWINKNLINGEKSNSNSSLCKLVFQKEKTLVKDIEIELTNTVDHNTCYTFENGYYKVVIDNLLKERKQEKELNDFHLYPLNNYDEYDLFYTSDINEKAYLLITDEQGNVILNEKYNILKGKNNIFIKVFYSKNNGILFYKFVTKNNLFSGKIPVIR